MCHILLDACENGVGHAAAIDFLHAFFVDVTGAVAVIEGLIDSSFDGISGFVFIEGVAKEHGSGRMVAIGFAMPLPAMSGAEP